MVWKFKDHQFRRRNKDHKNAYWYSIAWISEEIFKRQVNQCSRLPKNSQKSNHDMLERVPLWINKIKYKKDAHARSDTQMHSSQLFQRHTIYPNPAIQKMQGKAKRDIDAIANDKFNAMIIYTISSYCCTVHIKSYLLLL